MISNERNRLPPGLSSAAPLGAIAAFLLEHWREARSGGLLFLSQDEARAECLGAMLHALDPTCGVMVLPRWDSLPYDAVPPSPEATGRRSSVLRRLARHEAKPLLLATADSALPRVPPPCAWSDVSLLLRPGTRISEPDLRQFFSRAGYRLEHRVEAAGEASFHGQVVDVFPAGALGPVRIERGDDTIAGLSSYDPETQRTTGEVTEVVLDPVSEMLVGVSGHEIDEGARRSDAPAGNAQVTLFDYLPRARIVTDADIEARSVGWLQQVREAYDALKSIPQAHRFRGLVPPDRLFLDEQTWRQALERHDAMVLPQTSARDIRVPMFATQRSGATYLHKFIQDQLRHARRVVLTAFDEQHLRMLERRAATGSGSKAPARVGSWAEALQTAPGTISSLRVDFEAGFLLEETGVCVITAADLLGSRAAHATPFGFRDSGESQAGGELIEPGDAVVHLTRGLGVLQGLETVRVPETSEHDMVRLAYAGGDAILVPVEELGLIWKHGSAADQLVLDRADGSSWSKRLEKLEEELTEAAQRLVAIAAERASRTAPKLVPPAFEYERFVARFPYFATADQAHAVDDVLADLAAGRPMDRLVCGDVGFGKTEVALRATAAAVLSGKQVAVVVPTTVLARQHLETFRRRFAGLGIEIGHLSRFAKAGEVRAAKKGLADGSVRVVIGTHAISAKSVRFKELGLLVIDEEQRFGTRQKDKLRSMAADVHVLTFTATPIPRTLRLARLGLQDLSVIATPPARRLPVRTTVGPFDPELVRAALGYEHRRGGQSFVVCPHIEDMAAMELRLAEAAPELQLRAVHGKMPPEAIDDVMMGFAAGDGDVLLATNIIESGLDLPRANTIVVWRPDRFGIAQLHQLRGRVGRGSRRGFAYLLTAPDADTTRTARSRLRAIEHLSGVGTGFAISEHDLDLRGAGDLMGEAQAGHLKLAGPGLYRHLFDRACLRARGEEPPEDYLPELQLTPAGIIPTGYVGDERVRLELYTRVARAQTEGEIETIASEMEDRFGAAPAGVRDLIAIARIRLMCMRLSVARVEAGPQAVALTFRADPPRQIRGMRGSRTLHWSNGRLLYLKQSSAADRISTVTALLERLGAL